MTGYGSTSQAPAIPRGPSHAHRLGGRPSKHQRQTTFPMSSGLAEAHEIEAWRLRRVEGTRMRPVCFQAVWHHSMEPGTGQPAYPSRVLKSFSTWDGTHSEECMSPRPPGSDPTSGTDKTKQDVSGGGAAETLTEHLVNKSCSSSVFQKGRRVSFAGGCL